MGFPKAMLGLEGASIMAHHVKAYSSCGCAVAVVLGFGGGMIRRDLPPEVQVVENRSWQRTSPVESLQCALRCLGPGPVFVQPVDVPPVLPSTLAALLSAGPPAVPSWNGRRGHPVLLGPDLVGLLLERTPAGGLRDLLGAARVVPVDDPAVVLNLNRPAALARWLRDRARTL